MCYQNNPYLVVNQLQVNELVLKYSYLEICLSILCTKHKIAKHRLPEPFCPCLHTLILFNFLETPPPPPPPLWSSEKMTGFMEYVFRAQISNHLLYTLYLRFVKQGKGNFSHNGKFDQRKAVNLIDIKLVELHIYT